MTKSQRRRGAAHARWCVAGAIVIGGSVGCSRHAPSGDTQVAATVNKSEVSVHQINFMLQRQPGLRTEQVEGASRQALEQLIDRELAAQRAIDQGAEKDPATVMAVEEARRDALARAHMQRVADSVPKPAAAEIKAFYDAHPALFKERRVYELAEFLVQADKAHTDELVSRLRGAHKLDDALAVIKDMNLPARTSRSSVAAETLPTAIVDKIAALHDGQALVIPVQGGLRMIFVAASQAAPLNEEQAAPLIAQHLLGERRREAASQELKSLRAAAKIEYVGKYAQAASAAAPSVAQLPAPSASAAAPVTVAAAPQPAASGATATNDSVSRGLAGLR